MHVAINQLRIVNFWQEAQSPHMADLISAFASSHPELEVNSYSLSGKNGQQHDRWDWEEFTSAPAQIRYLQTSEIPDFMRRDPAVLHIFCGYQHGDFTLHFVEAAQRTGVSPILISEPGAEGLLSGPARLLRSRLRHRYFHQVSPCVLAIGANGPIWFQRAGFDPRRILPFAYFVNPPIRREAAATTATKKGTRVGFIGRLIPEKGIDDLLGSTKFLAPDHLVFLVGEGDAEYTRKAELIANVTLLGPIPHMQVWDWLSGIDCLVLPSRSNDDGWGVVVSEALMQGTPVVSTAKVGASVVLRQPLFGEVANDRDPRDIARCIDLVLAMDHSDEARSDRAIRARRMLSASTGAAYLWEAILFAMSDAAPPAAPWA